MDEYLANPEKYPAKIMLRNDEGKIAEQTLTIDQITDFEMVYASGMGGELYMSVPSKTSLSHGYRFIDGKFIIYSSISAYDEQILFSMSPELNLDKDTALPYYLGYFAVQPRLIGGLGLIPYTVLRFQAGNNLEDLIKGVNIFETIDRANGSLPSGTMTREEGEAWVRAHSSFKVR
ncbi:MAG: hypothetical protein WC837_01970 [Bellilinea sp.]